jgi:hypothetical protein
MSTEAQHLLWMLPGGSCQERIVLGIIPVGEGSGNGYLERSGDSRSVTGWPPAWVCDAQISQADPTVEAVGA